VNNTSSDDGKVYKVKHIGGQMIISTDQGDKCIVLTNYKAGLKDKQDVVADSEVCPPKECDVRIVLAIDKDMKMHITVQIEDMTLDEGMTLGDLLAVMVKSQRFGLPSKVIGFGLPLWLASHR